MADNKEEKKLGECCNVSICKAENGYKICCQFQREQTLGERAGWVPSYPNDCKDYVEKTKAAVIERLKKVL